MKRYKLVKDLPTFKAGDKFHLSINGNLVHDESGEVAYMKHTLKKFPNILEDWFEEIEDAGPWRPKDGERYWTISGLGDCHETSWDDNGLDLARYDIGNYFKTREDAVKATEWLKAFKVLRDDTKGYKNDGWQKNYFVYLNAAKQLCIIDDGSEVSSPIIFRTEDDAEDSIMKHRKEWLTFLGVEGDE